MGKNVVIFYTDNKNKDILNLGEGSTQGLDDTTLTAWTKYSITFTQPRKIFVFSLHYNKSNCFFFVNATKIYQFKANKSEIKNYALCLNNISKDFTINNMKKAGLKGTVNFFSVNLNPIDILDFDTNNILDIHRYLMKTT